VTVSSLHVGVKPDQLIKKEGLHPFGPLLIALLCLLHQCT